MAATLKASTTGLDLVDKARRKKGWAKAEPAWADLAFTSTATLKRFWAGVTIGADTFRAICKAVGIEDWEAIVEFKDDSESPSQISGKRISFVISGSIEKGDKHTLDAIVALLNQKGGDTSIGIVDIDDGSIRLILGGSEEALKQIEALFQSGELAEIEGIEVQDVHFLEKAEQVALLRRNGGEAQNLSLINLSGANLIGANLYRADLSHANLSSADLSSANLSSANLSRADLRDARLSRADLSSANLSSADLSHADLSSADLSSANLSSADLSFANLSGANLSDADLSRANLSGANLRGANLSDAKLRDADLSRADLSRADLSRANLSDANLSRANLSDADVTQTRFGIGIGLSDESKADLIARGAIFDDGLERTNEVLVPSR